MASINEYATITSSLLPAAGSPSYAASASRLEQFPDTRQVAEELERKRPRHPLQVCVRESGGRGVFEAFPDLLFQTAEHAIEKLAGYGFDFRGVEGLFVEEPREQQAQQIGRDAADGALGGQVLAVHVLGAGSVPAGDGQDCSTFNYPIVYRVYYTYPSTRNSGHTSHFGHPLSGQREVPCKQKLCGRFPRRRSTASKRCRL